MAAPFPKTVLITGANTGIGEAAARALARRGAKVFFACRSEAKTRPVMERITAQTGHADLHFLELELDDLASVQRCAADFVARGEALDVLLLNAGVGLGGGTTRQGFELMFGVNHLGHFALTLGLERALTVRPSRVVVVASRAHERTHRPLDEARLTSPTRSRTGWPEYQASKLANVLFARELARRWADRGVHTYALHPGVVATDIWRRAPAALRWLAARFMLTAEQGATASVHCATAPELAGETGRYYGERGEPRRTNPLADDPEAARWLWERSLAWTAPFRP